ncbi:hypothetical protein DPMN_072640 [Dreissena polymorpha]|uniref:Secreted protein n=1 Tax=Dreissena polymorpha TaxID=45954 RepID=A0A9D4BXN3_DREPO|nr:hypothetical protein DPMN_072640 [Dreissena polymorpha]
MPLMSLCLFLAWRCHSRPGGGRDPTQPDTGGVELGTLHGGGRTGHRQGARDIPAGEDQRVASTTSVGFLCPSTLCMLENLSSAKMSYAEFLKLAFSLMFFKEYYQNSKQFLS